MRAPGVEGHGSGHRGDAGPARRVKPPRARQRWAGAFALVAAVAAVAGCTGETSGRAVPARARYDEDSAARGFLAPELADLLAVDTLLDAAWLARNEGRCRVDTIPGIRHIRRRILAPLELGRSVLILTRTTPDGDIARVELVRLSAGRAPIAAARWDADSSESVLTEWPQRAPGPIRKTTSRDPDAPLSRSLRYIGRRANAVDCQGARARGDGENSTP